MEGCPADGGMVGRSGAAELGRALPTVRVGLARLVGHAAEAAGTAAGSDVAPTAASGGAAGGRASPFWSWPESPLPKRGGSERGRSASPASRPGLQTSRPLRPRRLAAAGRRSGRAAPQGEPSSSLRDRMDTCVVTHHHHTHQGEPRLQCPRGCGGGACAAEWPCWRCLCSAAWSTRWGAADELTRARALGSQHVGAVMQVGSRGLS